MLINEIISRKKYLSNKLIDIDNYILKLLDTNIEEKTSIYNKAIEIKFSLLSKIRSHEVLLHDQNAANTIMIGTSEISVYEGVKLRDTLGLKIKTLDILITQGDFNVINIFSLMEQRDSLFEEFVILNTIIAKSDITEEWKEKG